MRAADALAAFTRFAEGRGLDLRTIDAEAAVDAMLTWYELERADDVDVEDMGDMLLFQWGTYDWGGRSFDYNITRQLTFGEDDDQDIWHLSLTLHYPPDEPAVALGSGAEWCETPDGLPDLRHLIETAAATSLARSTPPSRVELTYEDAC